MKQKPTSLSKKGVTLVEIMIAASVFGIAFFASLLTQNQARQNAENALVKWAALNHAQGLLEIIQSYPYHEPQYDGEKMKDESDVNNSELISLCHVAGTIGSYSTGNSGIYKESSTSLERNLSKESLYPLYRPTTAQNDPLDPFTMDNSMQDLVRYVGPDGGGGADYSTHTKCDPANGIFVITDKEAGLNVFQGNDPDNADNPYQLAKYYFMDDVDDFDGYIEERKLNDKVRVTFSVSVNAIFGNNENYSDKFINNGGNEVPYTIVQGRYEPMREIIIGNNMLGLNLASAAAGQQAIVARNFYKQSIFKKVTVKAQWTYPEGSGRIHSVVLDGGVVSDLARLGV